MRKVLLGCLFAAVNGVPLWVLAQGNSGINSAVFVAVAALFNLVLGIRIGYESARAYARDVARLNRYLADQNESLVLSNRELLERLAASPSDAAEEESRRAGTGA